LASKRDTVWHKPWSIWKNESWPAIALGCDGAGGGVEIGKFGTPPYEGNVWGAWVGELNIGTLAGGVKGAALVEGWAAGIGDACKLNASVLRLAWSSKSFSITSHVAARSRSDRRSWSLLASAKWVFSASASEASCSCWKRACSCVRVCSIDKVLFTLGDVLLSCRLH
jgi:hypothetical protein